MAQAEGARGWERSARTVDLVVWLWRLLASAQFAVALIGFLAVAGLLAVVLPQMPEAVRDNPAAVDAWLDSKRGGYGVFTDPFHRVGLFTVIDAWWFLMGLGLLAVSVVVYSADRFVTTWRNVTRPRERVPDSFFDRAANRAAFETQGAGAAARLEGLLRRHRFRVRAATAGDATYLFADRFAWAQLGGFASHIAVVLLLAGGLVSHFRGFEQDLLIAEGTTSPVFAVSHPGQMLVEVQDAVASFDEEGSPTDFRSELVIFRNGREVARGKTTVNDPLSYNGYRFHQAGYLGDGAALRVTNATTGNAEYAQVLALDQPAAAPRIVVSDAQGNVLLDDTIVPTDLIEGALGTLLTVPGSGQQFWVGIAQAGEDDWRVAVYGPEAEDVRLVLAEGESQAADGLEWTFAQAVGLPSLLTTGIPGDGEEGLVMMARTPEGEPYLTVLGPVDGRALTLYPDEPVRIGDREYLFEGRREFAGIEVRKDPGVNLIWVGAGLLLAGLLVTFYVPRLRLWARVRGNETVLASLAERSGVFQSEARRIKRELDVEETKRGGEANG